MQQQGVGPSDQVLIGWLLVAGPALFMIGAVGWKPWDFDRPLEHALPRIAAQPLLWRWIHGWIALGVVVTAASLASFQSLARELGDRVLAPFGAVLYALGALAMLITLAFRVTVEVAAASQTVSEGRVPTAYFSLHQWAGLRVSLHMLLSHLGAVALGSRCCGLLFFLLGSGGARSLSGSRSASVMWRWVAPFRCPCWRRSCR